MNGGIIGGASRAVAPSRAGVWTPGDADFLDWAGKPFPTLGLANHWPLTSDANDVVGTLHFTNNNSVTFDANGAHFTEASKNYLSATRTFGTSFAWVCDFNIGSSGRFTLGVANWDRARLGISLCVNEASNDKALIAAFSSNLDNLYVAKTQNFRDSAWHRVVLNVRADGDGRRMINFYIDSPTSIVDGIAVSGYTMSTSFALGRRGGGVSTPESLNWWGNGYARDLRIYDRSLTQLEIMRVLAV